MPENFIDFNKTITLNAQYLYKAFYKFKSIATDEDKEIFNTFCIKNNYWLDDFALFISIMRHYENQPWYNWDEKTKKRDTKTIHNWQKQLAEPIKKQKFFQWLFFKQWLAVKKYANEKGIQIIGDIPIFVSMNSADVWAHTGIFYFDSDLKPKVISGVPPDYFSETGQLWGHPLYDWKAVAKTKYAWWINRFRMAFNMADVIRIDHFRGLYNYWEIPSKEKTAINGKWKNGPGKGFFNKVVKEFGDILIIAEDLGDFDEASRIGVENLRKRFTFPGMKILQFAFNSDANNSFLPHNFKNDYIVYTGTHDNDTILGWYKNSSSEKERDYARRFMSVNGNDISWDLIKLAWSSVADTAITTIQDLLSLGNDSRMNTPGTVGPQNWSWRFVENSLTQDIANRLRDLTKIYGRLNEN